MPAAYLRGPTVPPSGDKSVCAGKEAFATQSQATLVCHDGRRRALQPFRCRSCRLWHLGVPVRRCWTDER